MSRNPLHPRTHKPGYTDSTAMCLQIMHETGLPHRTVIPVVRAFIREIANHLGGGDPVTLHMLGNFSLKKRKGRKVTNNFGTFEQRDSIYVKFTPGAYLKKKLTELDPDNVKIQHPNKKFTPKNT